MAADHPRRSAWQRVHVNVWPSGAPADGAARRTTRLSWEIGHQAFSPSRSFSVTGKRVPNPRQPASRIRGTISLYWTQADARRGRSVDTVTSITLLNGLRDLADRQAWDRFMQRYQPLVAAFATKMGLGEHDVQDACQETLLAFVAGYRAGNYDRDKGRLRSWLFGIAHRKVTDIRRHVRDCPVVADRTDATGVLAAVPSPEAAAQFWEQEWERAVLRACLAEVARQFDVATMQAFELYVLDERPAEEVAERLGTTRNAVYLSKHRVMNRMCELRPQMEEIW